MAHGVFCKLNQRLGTSMYRTRSYFGMRCLSQADLQYTTYLHI